MRDFRMYVGKDMGKLSCRQHSHSCFLRMNMAFPPLAPFSYLSRFSYLGG